MPRYIGFSTINVNKPRSTNLPAGADGGSGGIPNPIIFGKKFQTVDEQLVIQDFINAMNIQQGQKVGQPGYGTTLWSFVFEPNTYDVQFQLENEIRRIVRRLVHRRYNTRWSCIFVRPILRKDIDPCTKPSKSNRVRY